MLPRARRRRERPAGAQQEDAADRYSQNAFHEPSSVGVSPVCRCCPVSSATVISQKRIVCQGKKKSRGKKKKRPLCAEESGARNGAVPPRDAARRAPLRNGVTAGRGARLGEADEALGEAKDALRGDLVVPEALRADGDGLGYGLSRCFSHVVVTSSRLLGFWSAASSFSLRIAL